MTQWGLDTLFNPAKRHMDEEKQRLQSTREEVGDNSGGRRIDLESGKVVIRKAEDEADDEGGTEPGAASEDTTSSSSTSSSSTSSSSTAPDKPAKARAGQDAAAPSAAAQRAAARRGRTAR